MTDILRLGVVIGRFQVHKLSEGHLHLLFCAKAVSDIVLVLIGSANQSRSISNPLSVRERMDLFDGLGVRLGWVEDVPGDDEKWSAQVDGVLDCFIEAIKQGRRVEEVSPLLFHGRDSFVSHYSGKWLDQLRCVGNGRGLTGSEIRRRVVQCAMTSEDFRIGIIKGVTKALQGQP